LEAERTDDGSPREVLVFVLTDGELLDFAPADIPDNFTVIGVLSESASGRSSRWSDVLPTCKAFDLSTPELYAAIRHSVSPAGQLYEIKATFPITKTSQVPRGLSLRRRAHHIVEWDFSKGDLTLTADRTALNDKDAFIECQPRAGKSTRLHIHGLTKGLPLHLNAGGVAAENASIKDGSFVVIDDPDLVARLYEHIKSREQERQSWDVEFVKTLRRVVSQTTVATIESTARGFDAALAIFMPGTTRSEASAKKLAVGLLYRDRGKYLCIKPTSSAPENLGFTVHKITHLSYNELEARWQLTHGEECKNLDPRGSQRLAELFFDMHGIACEAFYSGQIDSSSFE